MSMLQTTRVCLAFFVVAFLASCASAPPIPTATVVPTALPSPTPTETISIDDDMTYEQAVHLFDYDSTVPFEVKDVSEPVEEDGVTVSNILYTAHSPEYGVQGQTLAYLVRPNGDGPFAAILFVHWLGKNSNRDEFLEEAKSLAKQGVVSLLIQGTFPWTKSPKEAASDRLDIIEQTIELRRAVDFLLTQPGVDPQRIAFVGHDYGGLYGGVLSGVEKRIKAYALMTAPGNFSNWSIEYFLSSSVDPSEYRKQMTMVEPMMYISHAAPASLLFQFSNSDGFVPKEEANQFFDAASEPKEIKWYDSSHQIQLDETATSDRLDWLATQLKLQNVP